MSRPLQSLAGRSGHRRGRGVTGGIQPVELLTVQEVAEELRVSTMTVYRLLKSGALPALRVGKGYRIRPADLQSYLARSRA